ncbi:MAG: beta strand repeat-containing protein, partial [Ignavibacteria bacterium]
GSSDTPLIKGDFGATTLTFNGAITTTGTSALNGDVTLGTAASATGGSIIMNDNSTGDSYTATIALANLSASRAYTIPEVSADASFVMTAGAQTIAGNKTFSGTTAINGGAAAAELRFLEPSGSGSNYTAFKAQAQAADVTYTLPATDGSSGQVLQTNGSGTLSWNTPSSVGAINDLTDAVKGIANFSNSMILGHELTGTLSSADNNTAVGVASMQAITSGDQNVALGYASLAKVTSGSQNTAVGNTAGNEITTGTQNVCLGHEAGFGIEDGTNNIAIGYGVYRNGAINATNVGSYNIGIGGAALYNGPFGNGNIAVGQSALANAADAANNIAIGYEAGNGVTSGDNNVLLGYQAGRTLTTGTGNVFIGYQTGSGVAVGTSNTLMISNSNDATPLIQGDFSANTLTFNGATTTTGNVTIAGTTTYSAPSSSKTVTATTSTGAGAPDIASFTNTYEMVTVTADGAAAGFVQLPTGTEGQIAYVRFLFSGSQTVTIVNSNTAATNTAMVFDGSGADVIVAHMLYTGTAEGWVVFSALEYDN